MKKLLTHPASSRHIAIAMFAVLVFTAGTWYWLSHLTDNLAGRF